MNKPVALKPTETLTYHHDPDTGAYVVNSIDSKGNITATSISYPADKPQPAQPTPATN
jgi:hypothetical protein